MSKFLELSLKLLSKNGVSCTFNKYIKGAFNSTTGEYEKVLNKTNNSFFIFTNFEKGTFEEDINLSNKEKGILAYPTVDFNIDIDTEFIFSGKSFKVLKIKEVYDKDVVVLYKLIVKENEK